MAQVIRSGGKQRCQGMAEVGPGGKHHRRNRLVLRDNLQGITKGDIRRLARRGGVKRISGLCYDETRDVLKKFLTTVMHDVVTYMEHAHRKTVICNDVTHALKRQGRTIYGFGGELRVSTSGPSSTRRHSTQTPRHQRTLRTSQEPTNEKVSELERRVWAVLTTASNEGACLTCPLIATQVNTRAPTEAQCR